MRGMKPIPLPNSPALSPAALMRRAARYFDSKDRIVKHGREVAERHDGVRDYAESELVCRLCIRGAVFRAGVGAPMSVFRLAEEAIESVASLKSVHLCDMTNSDRDRLTLKEVRAVFAQAIRGVS